LSDNRAKEQASAARYGLEAEETLSDPAPGGIFRPLRHAPAYRALSARIERMILSGQLKPGDSLPTETALAERFGVNRSTVREAIRLLEQEGLVSRTTGRRLQVDMPGLFDLAPRASRALLLQHVTFLELWEVALVVEPLAARMAASTRSDADLAAIEDNIATTAHAVERQLPTADHDVAFHALLARASGNRMLMLAREPVSLLYAPTLGQVEARLPQAAARNLDAHRQLYAAIHDQDAEQAEQCMRWHLADFRRGFELAGFRLDEAVRWPADPLLAMQQPPEETLT